MSAMVQYAMFGRPRRFYGSLRARRARRAAAFAARYPTWRAALADACAMLFALNRWVKYRDCSVRHREEIYALKNDFVEMLYRQGFCVAAWEHRMRLAAKLCWGCDGDGCDRCDGTGVFRPGRELRFICFRFQVGETTYTWHQPEDLIGFAPVMTDAPADWMPGEREKTIPLAKRRFCEAKDLLRWVLRSARA